MSFFYAPLLPLFLRVYAYRVTVCIAFVSAINPFSNCIDCFRVAKINKKGEKREKYYLICYSIFLLGQQIFIWNRNSLPPSPPTKKNNYF